MKSTDWIKVTERLPDTTGHSVDYLVATACGDKFVTAWMNIGGWGFEPETPITHWMEIGEPEP